VANEWFYNGNTFYADTASTAATTSSYIEEKDILVESIILSADANASVVIHDLRFANGAFSAGDEKLHVHCLAHDTNVIALNSSPIRFPNGVWISSITSGATVTFILKRKG
jgi:hypothetical protein